MKKTFRKITARTLAALILCAVFLPVSASGALSDKTTVIHSNTLAGITTDEWEWKLIRYGVDMNDFDTVEQIFKDYNPMVGETVSDYYLNHLMNYKIMILYGFPSSLWNFYETPSGYSDAFMDSLAKINTSSLCYYSFDASGDKPAAIGRNAADVLGEFTLDNNKFTTVGEFDDVPNVAIRSDRNFYCWMTDKNGVPRALTADSSLKPKYGTVESPQTVRYNDCWYLKEDDSNEQIPNMMGGRMVLSGNSKAYISCPQGPYFPGAKVSWYYADDENINANRVMILIGKKVGKVEGAIMGNTVIPSGNTVKITENTYVDKAAVLTVEPGARLIVDRGLDVRGRLDNYGTIIIGKGGALNVSMYGTFRSIGTASYECSDGTRREDEGNVTVSSMGRFSITTNTDWGTKISLIGGQFTCAGTFSNYSICSPTISATQTNVYFPYNSVYLTPTLQGSFKPDLDGFRRRFCNSTAYTLVNENFLLDD